MEREWRSEGVRVRKKYYNDEQKEIIIISLWDEEAFTLRTR